MSNPQDFPLAPNRVLLCKRCLGAKAEYMNPVRLDMF